MHANGDGPGGDYVNADEAAAILGVSAPTIVRAIRAKRLPAIKLDRTWRIPRAALAAGHGTNGHAPATGRDALALIAEARAKLDQAERAILAEREERA